MKYIVIHYSEIATKGKNRKFFEKTLYENISKRIAVKELIWDFGQIILGVEGDVEKIISKIPGISHFVVGERVENNIEKIKEKTIEILRKKNFDSFKIDTLRHNKNFKNTSVDVNIAVGQIVKDQLNKRVQPKNPDLTVFIEICGKITIIGTERHEGLGGFPIGSIGKVAILLSGGIDSPVAAYFMMRRGCEVILVHFENETIQKAGVQNKIRQLSEKIAEFQGKVTLYTIPFGEIQKEIVMRCPSEYRMIIYRYFMMKISSKIADIEGALSLVTGDNLAQVASQTLENLNALYSLVDKIVLSPLIGLNKNEIIEISRKIETYEISILPYGDCCSFLVSDHPQLRAKKEVLKEILEKFEIDIICEKAVKNFKKVEITSP